MCGIVGFTGAAQAAPILLDGLAKLEYRGYDSAGMAVQNAAGKIEVVKAKGRLKVLSEMTDGGSAVPGSCGIGHTRWATHGEPSVVNAHPHYSRDQKIAVVHNGIIENYQEIKERLINKGFSFVSQTDTEVVAQLLDYYYMGESAGNALDAITRMMLHVRGSYALGVLFADEPGVIYAVRKDSPLIVGKCEDGAIIASDVPALLKYTRTVYYIDNLEIARLTPDSIEFFNIDKEPITRESTTIEWDAEAAEKGGYEHFMMKEIYEQPAIRSPRASRTARSTCPSWPLTRRPSGMSIVSTSSAAALPTMSAWPRAMCLRAWPAFPSRSMSPASSVTAIPCSKRTHSLWSSARAVRPPTRWPPCACARSAVCAPSAL